MVENKILKLFCIVMAAIADLWFHDYMMTIFWLMMVLLVAWFRR